MPRSPGRAGHAFRVLSAVVRREEPDCWICGLPIDGQRRFPDPWSWSLDHAVELWQHGAPLSRENAHSAHLTCNIRKSNRLRSAARRAQYRALRTSRTW